MFRSSPALVLLLGGSAIVAAAGAAGWLRESVVPAYIGHLIALLLAAVMVLAVFLVLLARMTQRTPGP